MNSRERLLRTFRREPVDRVPIAPLIHANAVYRMFGYKPDIDVFTDPPDFDLLGKYVEYCDHFGFDAALALCNVWDFYGWGSYCDHTVTRAWDNWDVTIADERKGEAKRRTIGIATPRGKLRHVEEYRMASPFLVVWATTEHLIKTREDFEIFRQFSPPSDMMDCRLITRGKEAVGDKGILYPCVPGAFNSLNLVRKLDQVMQDPYEDEGFYREMIGHFTERLIARIPKWAKAGVDALEVAGNLATSMVGPEFFRNYIMEYERKILDAVHQAGLFTGYHNCGDAATIMRLYNDLPIDCWGYLTPRPYGDVDLDEALRVMRPDMVLRGNIDHLDFLRTAGPGKIRDAVRELLEKVKPRGHWILATTDFWMDDVPDENIMAFSRAGVEFGFY
jgi:hypothetical protein